MSSGYHDYEDHHPVETLPQIDQDAHAAAREGRLADLHRLLQNGADFESVAAIRAHRLIHAAAGGLQPRVLSWLLDRGAAPDARAVCRLSALHCAVHAEAPADLERQIHTIRVLLDRGADVNARDDCGETPLKAAAWSSPVATAYLLSRGANPNAANQFWGVTPLHMACRSSPNVLDTLISAGMLLAAGADPAAREQALGRPRDRMGLEARRRMDLACACWLATSQDPAVAGHGAAAAELVDASE